MDHVNVSFRLMAGCWATAAVRAQWQSETGYKWGLRPSAPMSLRIYETLSHQSGTEAPESHILMKILYLCLWVFQPGLASAGTDSPVAESLLWKSHHRFPPRCSSGGFWSGRTKCGVSTFPPVVCQQVDSSIWHMFWTWSLICLKNSFIPSVR